MKKRPKLNEKGAQASRSKPKKRPKLRPKLKEKEALADKVISANT